MTHWDGYELIQRLPKKRGKSLAFVSDKQRHRLMIKVHLRQPKTPLCGGPDRTYVVSPEQVQ